MNENNFGYIPQHYQDRIKPPVISFALGLVGLVLIALGAFFILSKQLFVNLGILPVTILVTGFLLFAVSIGYIIGRRNSIAVEKRNDYDVFALWLHDKYELTPTEEQIQQLREYKTVVVDNKRYILYYELEPDIGLVGYLLTEAEQKEKTVTGKITLPPSLNEHNEIGELPAITIPISIIDNDTVDDLATKTVAELKTIAQGLGLEGYSKLSKKALIELLTS